MFKLVKDIKSKEGIQHFKRWQLFSCKWFSIYLHGIYKEDLDKHCHNHAWNILTIILWGSYTEKLLWCQDPDCFDENRRWPLDIAYRSTDDYHKILTLHTKKVYSLAIVGKRGPDEWGYMMDDGEHLNHLEYRKLKANKS